MHSVKSYDIVPDRKENLLHRLSPQKLTDYKRSIGQHASKYWNRGVGMFNTFHRTSKNAVNDVVRASNLDLPLPRIPNGNFARKYGLISHDHPLEKGKIMEQKTACQKLLETDQNS